MEPHSSQKVSTNRTTNGNMTSHPNSGSSFKTQTLDKNTTLFSFQDINGKNQIQILYFVPQEGQSPFCGFSPDLIERLNTPTDITYSQNKPQLQALAKEFHLFNKFSCIPVELGKIIQYQKGQLHKIGSRLQIFLQSYYTKPSLPFRCPSLVGFKSSLLLLLISFVFKAYFAFSFTHHLHHEQAAFGDADAQFHRHWQEIAINFPIHEWYVKSAYNRPRCFLDYPIMTQYLHFFMAQYITNPLVPQALRLSTLQVPIGPIYDPFNIIDSTTFEEYSNYRRVKIYPYQISTHFYSSKYDFISRLTYLIFDTLILGGASLALGTYLWRKINPRLRFCATLLLLLTPLAILIDHGNPQVNFLPLALFMLAVRFALSNHFALSAIMAILAVNSKVAALCVMAPFGVLVLSRLSKAPQFRNFSFSWKFLYLVKILISVFSTMVLLYWPLLGKTSLMHVAKAVFPSRQYSEQPLPNVIHIINQYFIQLRSVPPSTLKGRILSIVSTLLTVSLALPSLKALAQNPSTNRFIRAIQLNALVFTQVGYCVHQKIFLWFVIPLTFSIFDDSHHLYFSSTIVSLAGAFFIVIDSRNWSPFYILGAFQLLFFLFYRKFPKANKQEQSQGVITFLSKGVNQNLSLIILGLSIYGFQMQGDLHKTDHHMYYTQQMCVLLAFANIPIWCYLHKRAFQKEQSDFKLKYD